MITILRGLPGSGKSSWARTIKPKIVCSADDFHIVDGIYKFELKNIKFAHASCLRKYIETIVSGTETHIIVDNTNIRLEDIAPYVRIAEAFGLSYVIRQYHCTVEQSFTRNVHGVPLETIKKMFEDYKQLPWPTFNGDDLR